MSKRPSSRRLEERSARAVAQTASRVSSKPRLRELSRRSPASFALPRAGTGIVDYVAGWCEHLARRIAEGAAAGSSPARAFLGVAGSAKDVSPAARREKGTGERRGRRSTAAGLHSDRVLPALRRAVPSAAALSSRSAASTSSSNRLRAHARLSAGWCIRCPIPVFPFLGVHFTRSVDGGLTAGPNAVPAFAQGGLSPARRGVGATSRSCSAPPGSGGSPGAPHVGMGAVEIWRDLVKPASRRADAPLRAGDRVARRAALGPTGARAQCLRGDGSLAGRFPCRELPGLLHILNAPSPAATAPLVIGRHLAGARLPRAEPSCTINPHDELSRTPSWTHISRIDILSLEVSR